MIAFARSAAVSPCSCLRPPIRPNSARAFAAHSDAPSVMNRREYTGNLLREAYQALDSGRSAGTNRTTVGAYRR